MSEMIKRVSDAIDDCLGGYVPYEESERAARAAIAAMREPTEEMVRLGEYNLEACLEDPCGKAALHTYRTMIDVASKT